MANRHQRRRRAERKRQERVRDRLIGEGVRERDRKVAANKHRRITDEERAWMKASPSCIVLCEQAGARSGGYARNRRQTKVDGRWQ